MAKVDLKSAYRSVRTAPSSWAWTGLHWTFTDEDSPTFMCDTRLPFGARRAPGIFHRITQAVRRSLQKQGFSPLVVYVDDFLIISPSKEECQTAFSMLITILRSLGFGIAWNKVIDPTQCLTFLGIEINTVLGTLSLNHEKREKLIAFLEAHLKRKRLSQKQLQRLAGKLSWAASVIPWGRLHIRSLFTHLSALHSPNHKCLTATIAKDLHWWLLCLRVPSHRRRLWDTRPSIAVHCDASQHAGGAFCLNDWFYTAWSADLPSLNPAHINTKELAIAVAAIFHWAPQLRNHRVHIVTDSSTTAAILNKGTSPSPAAVDILRCLSALATVLDISVFASHIPGCDNHIPDAISRLHCPGQLHRLGSLLHACYLPTPWLPRHMSHHSLFFLLSQVAHATRNSSDLPFNT